MKKIYSLSILCALLSLRLSAQPVLHYVEDFTIGSSSRYRVVDPASINKGTGGPNKNWDFSQLTTSDTLYQDIVSPDSTPYAAQFPNADFAERNDDGTYVFVKKNNNGNDVVGFVDANQGLVIQYSNPYRFIERPFGYQDSIKDVFQRSFFFAGSDNTGTGNSLTTADAYGTLTLPNGTYNNVLRVYFEQVSTDTSQSTGMPTTVSIYTYAWFDTEHKSALLKIDSTIVDNMFYKDTIVDVTYLIDETITTDMQPSAYNRLDFKAHAKDGMLNLYGNLEEDNCTLLLTNMLGQRITEQKLTAHDNRLQLSLQDIKPGIYVAHLRTANGRQGSVKFIYN